MNNMINKVNSPWVSLCYLLALTLGSAIVIQLFVVVLGLLLMGDFSALVENGLSIDFQKMPVFSYAMIIASSFSTFLLPAWILQRIEPYNNYFPIKNNGFGFLCLLATLFMVAFVPMMMLIAEWNEGLVLSNGLEGIESWMRLKEDEMAELTKNMVMVDSWSLLFVNLFAVAVMPAIAEEYFFRGSLLHIFGRVFKNHHVTIWLTAIIFSAIHVQFFGFVPRMLMGAFFGYMLLWSQNIWVSIVGHFVNNGSAVIMAFYYTRQGKTYEEMQSYEGYSIFVYLGSFLVSAAIGWYFYNKTRKINRDGKGLD